MRNTLLYLAALALSAGLGVSVAEADDPSCTEVRPGFVQCTETHIEGDRPRAYFLLGRSQIRYEPPPLRREGAIRAVVRSVQRRPF